MDNIETKICSKCGVEKELCNENFSFRKDQGRYCAKCRICVASGRKEYRSRPDIMARDKAARQAPEYKDRTSKYQQEYLSRPEVQEYKKEYRKEYMEEYYSDPENADYKKQYGRRYYEEHKEELFEYMEEYRHREGADEQFRRYRETYLSKPGTAKHSKEYQAEYYEKNKDRIAERDDTPENRERKRKRENEYQNKRRKEDPVFRMKKLVSGSVNAAIKNNGGSKNGISCWKNSPYTGEELAKHIENQFEWWMHWDNQGVYDPGVWDDSDPATWRWQIDHIVPHIRFTYTSPNDEGCKKAWALVNLRPLSAKQNVLDKHYRTDEQIKTIKADIVLLMEKRANKKEEK